jgi:hypothetical protein
MPQRLKPGDHGVYTGPCLDIGGAKTGTTGVVERIARSGDMVCVRRDVVGVHAGSYKHCLGATACAE